MITRTDLLNGLAKEGAYWNTGVTFKRTNPVPIENYSIFGTLAEAQTYAFENPVAYPGQTLAVVTETNKVTLYVIQSGAASAEESLAEVGSATLGDGLSIELTDGKQLKLKDFGTKYYKQVTDEETGEITYEVVSGFKAGLEPRVRLNDNSELEIAWYEPSSTTVEGLSKTIDSIREEVETVSGIATGAQSQANTNAQKLTELEPAVENHESRLSQAEANITSLQGNTYTKTEVDQKIADQAHFSAKIVNTTNDVTEQNVIYLIKDNTAVGQDVYKEYILVENVPTCIGDTSTNLSGYVTTETLTQLLADKADTDAVESEISRVEGLITNVDNKLANYTTSENLAATLADYAKTTDVDAKVKVATDAAAANATSIQELTGTVGQNTANIATNAQGIVDVNARVDNVVNDVAAVNTRIDQLGTTYATDAEVAAIKEGLEKAHADDIAAIEATLGSKANVADVYTKNEVDTKFGGYYTKEQTDNAIAALFGSSSDLADYITDNRDTIPGLLSTDQENLIAGIDGRINAVTVKSSEEISVTPAEDGGVTLGINKVDVSKLNGDVTLYLNCGDAQTK